MRRLAAGSWIHCAVVLGMVSGCGKGTAGGPGRPLPTPAGQPRIELEVGTEEGRVVFSTADLPAVSSDGQLVAIAYQGEDGGRGAPNMKLQLKSVNDDGVEREVVILSPDEPEPPPAAELGRRLDDANSLLAGAWAPLASSPELEPRFDDAGPHMLSVAGYEVTYAEPHLTVVEPSGQRVVDGDFRDWSVQPYPMCADCEEAETEMCENPATLRQAWIDPAREVLVLSIAYLGTDACWEPDHAVHVIALP